MAEDWVSPLPHLQGTAATTPENKGWVSPMPHLFRDESRATGLADLVVPKTEPTAQPATPSLTPLRGSMPQVPVGPSIEQPASRGLLGDLASSIARGLVIRLPEQIGHVVKGIPRIPEALGIYTPEHEEGGSGWFQKVGDAITNFTEEFPKTHPFLAPSKEEALSWWRRGITGTFENAPASLTPMFTGFLIGSALGPPGSILGGLIGGGLATMATFGLSSYNQTYEDALKAGKDTGEARSLGRKIALIEGGIEALTDPLQMALPGPGRLASGTIKETIRSMLRMPLKATAKATMLKIAPIETGTEMLQDWWEANILQGAGMKTPEPWEAVKEAILPSIGMSILFGAGTHAMNVKQRNQIYQLLTDPNADPNQRVQAALSAREYLKQVLPEEDQDLVNLWDSRTANTILSGKGIPLDADFIGYLNSQEPHVPVPGPEPAAPGVASPPEIPPPAPPATPAVTPAPGPAIPLITPEAPVVPPEVPKPPTPTPAPPTPGKPPVVAPAAPAPAPEGAPPWLGIGKKVSYEGKGGTTNTGTVRDVVYGPPDGKTPMGVTVETVDGKTLELKPDKVWEPKRLGLQKEYRGFIATLPEGERKQAIKDSKEFDRLILQHADLFEEQGMIDMMDTRELLDQLRHDVGQRFGIDNPFSPVQRANSLPALKDFMEKARPGSTEKIELPKIISIIPPTKPEIVPRPAPEKPAAPAAASKEAEEPKSETPSETFKRIDQENAAFGKRLDSLPVGTKFTLGKIPGAASFSGTWERVDVAGDPFWKNQQTGEHKYSSKFVVDKAAVEESIQKTAPEGSKAPEQPPVGLTKGPFPGVRRKAPAGPIEPGTPAETGLSPKQQTPKTKLEFDPNFEPVSAEEVLGTDYIFKTKDGQYVLVDTQGGRNEPVTGVLHNSIGDAAEEVENLASENAGAIGGTEEWGGLPEEFWSDIKDREKKEKSPKPPIAQPGKEGVLAPVAPVGRFEPHTAIQKFATRVRDRLNVAMRMVAAGREEVITQNDLMDLGKEYYGRTRAEGGFTPREAYDAMEMGVNTYIKEHPEIANLEGINKILHILPTQSIRTEEMQQLQQFSTPPNVAYAANWLGKVNNRDVFAETSAGNGGLAVFADIEKPKKMILNELAKDRVENLKYLFPDAMILNENAEHISDILAPKLAPDEKPTVAVINPPFSTSGGRMPGKKILDIVNQHINQALQMLQPNGRLVVITGRGFAPDAPMFKEYFDKLKSEYNVRANVGLDGKNYKKYGTSFDIRMTVIDKTGPTQGEVYAKDFVTPEEMLNDPKLQEVRDGRPEIQRAVAGEQRAGQPIVEAGYQEPGKQPGVGRPVLAPAINIVPGQGPGVTPEAGVLPVVGRNEPAQPTGVTELPGVERGVGRGALPGGERPGEVRAPGVGGINIRTAGVERPGIEPGIRPGVGPTAVTPENQIIGVTIPAKTELKDDKIYQPVKYPKQDMGGEHPSALVTAVSLVDIEPPDVSNIHLNLTPENLKGNDKGKISSHQVYVAKLAKRAHDRGFAFFNAGGTGSGKGLTNAAILMAAKNSGKKKLVWMSYSKDLQSDARRDWKMLGGKDDDIIELGKIKNNISIEDWLKAKNMPNQGILFFSYNLLSMPAGKSEGAKPRLEQVLEWLGPNFDGIIIFDESHSMANALPSEGRFGRKKPSQRALTGIDFQDKLPNAKIVYSSATGATELANLAYAQGLKIWGPGTAFPDVYDFLGKVSPHQTAGLEMVAADLARKGLYDASSISFEGVTQEKLTHELTPEQTGMYNDVAKMWQKVLHNMHAIMAGTGANLNSAARKNAGSIFWGSQQRFFLQMLLAIQMPTVVSHAKEQIAQGNSPVFQLVNTNEASQERSLAKMSEDQELEEMDFTPKDILITYLERSFPTGAYEEYTDENGNVRSRPVLDSEGNHVQDQNAVAARDSLIADLGGMKFPENPLDFLVKELGQENIAEVTGRGRRLIWKADKRIEEKRGEDAIRGEVQDFYDDKRRSLVFSGKGSTGFSFDSDKSFQNQRKRIHYLVQAGWRADQVFQGLGRTHRANEAIPPHIVRSSLNVPAAQRFDASIGGKLKSLGAVSRGQRETTSQGLFSAREDLQNAQAREALTRFYEDLNAGSVPNMTIAEFANQTGLKLMDDQGQLLETLPPIQQFLNRMLSMELDAQRTTFNHFSHLMDMAIESAEKSGRLDLGLRNLHAIKTDVLSDKVVHSDADTGAKTNLMHIQTTHEAPIFTYKQMTGWAERVMRNAKSGKLWAMGKAFNRTKTDGSVERVRPFRSANYTSEYIREEELSDLKRWSTIPKDQIQTEWEKAIDQAPKTMTRDHYMITGMKLPIWDRMGTSGGLWRFQTPDGKTMVGKEIHSSELEKTLKNLNAEADAIKMTAPEVFEHILDNNKVVTLSNGWKFRRTKSQGEERIEVVGPDTAFHNSFRQMGIAIEMIDFKTRYFIPTNKEKAIPILEKLLLNRLITAVGDRASNKVLGSLPEEPGYTAPWRTIGAVTETHEFNVGDFVEFDFNGKVVKGKVRDIDIPGKTAWIMNDDPNTPKMGDNQTTVVNLENVRKLGKIGTAPTKRQFLSKEWKDAFLEKPLYPASEAADFLAKNSPILEDRTLMQAFIASPGVVKKLEKLNIKNYKKVGELPSKTPTAFYNWSPSNPSRRFIGLAAFDLQAKSPSQVSGAMTEELIHGLVRENMTKEDERELELMRKAALAALPGEEGRIADRDLPSYDSSDLQLKGLISQDRVIYYALKPGGDELMAGAIRYREVRQFLKTIYEVEGINKPSLWDRFVQWMNRVIFGTDDQSNRSLLNQVLEKAGELIQKGANVEETAQRQMVGDQQKFYSLDDPPLPTPMQDNIDALTDPHLSNRAAADPNFITFFKSKMGILHIPGNDLGILEQYLSLPFYLSKKYPVFKKLLNTQITREELRSDGINQFMQAAQPFLTLKGDEVAKVERALTEGDKEKAVYNEAQLRERFGLSNAGIESYSSVRTTLDSMLNRWADHAEWALMHPYEKRLSGPEYQQLLGIYKTVLTPDEIAALPPKVARAYQRLQPGVNLIKRIRARVAELKGYFPRYREPGKYYIAVKEKQTDEQGVEREVTTFTTFANSEWEATKIVNNLKEEKEPNETIVYGRHVEEPESSFFGTSDTNLQRLVDNSIQGVKKEGQITEQQALELRHQLSQSLAEMLLARGSGARMIKRSKNLIGGYQTDQLQQVLKNYIVGYMGMETKQDAAYEFLERLGDVPKNQPQLFGEASHYVDSMLRNYDKQDQKFSKVRALAFTYYLAGSIRAAAIQMTQNFVTGIPFLAREMRGQGKGLFAAERYYIKAMKDIVMGKMTEEERFMDHEVLSKGIANDQLIRSLTAEIGGATNQTMFKVSQILAAPFSKMEIFNRRSAALARYRLAQEQGLNFEESLSKVTDFIYNTHYLMTKANLPHAARSGDIPSKLIGTAYTFRRFTHNYILSMIYSLSGPDGKFNLRNVDVFFHSLAWIMVFGGLSALPFLDDLLDEAERFFGRPYRQEIRNWLTQIGGTPLERAGVAGLPAMLGQIPGMVGVDISGSLRIGLPRLTDPMQGAKETVFGVWGGLGQKAASAYRAVNVDDYMRAFEFASPVMLENILKATRMSTMGATTPQGKTMFDIHGKPIKETTGEAVGQVMGFRPARIAEMSEERRTFKNVESYFAGKRNDLYTQFRLAKVPEDRRDVIKDVQKYNLEASKYRGAVPMINTESLRKAITEKPEKDYRIWGIQQQK